MGYPGYYDGEIEIAPPLTEEHAAIVRDFAKGDQTDLIEPIFAAIAASDEPDLPYSCGLYEVAEDAPASFRRRTRAGMGWQRWSGCWRSTSLRRLAIC